MTSSSSSSQLPPWLPLPHKQQPQLIKSTSSLFHISYKQRNRFPTNLNCHLSDNGAHSYNQQQKQWTVDCVGADGSEPIHIIIKPPVNSTVNSLAMSGGNLKNAKKVCLFYAAEMEELAKRIAAQSDAIELRGINWSYALPKLFISSFTLVLPFFPTGTSERMEEEGDIATAFTLARFLVQPFAISRRGVPTIVEFIDIHCPAISIAFPDDGAWKRFHKQLQHFPMIICAKVREGDQRIVRIKEGDPKGRHVVIVDDLVQSGGTLIECQVMKLKQKVLAEHGATKVSAYVTHGVFPKRSWERFAHDKGGNPDNGLTYFWITDSCPLTVKEVKNKPPFEVLSLASSIAATLQI
ncbi:ribose-phosphate pyrophosphokinase 4-like protein [Tanacetum coccineum]